MLSVPRLTATGRSPADIAYPTAVVGRRLCERVPEPERCGSSGCCHPIDVRQHSCVRSQCYAVPSRPRRGLGGSEPRFCPEGAATRPRIAPLRESLREITISYRLSESSLAKHSSTSSALHWPSCAAWSPPTTHISASMRYGLCSRRPMTSSRPSPTELPVKVTSCLPVQLSPYSTA